MNIKKLFPENKATKKRFLEFLDKKGFYIVLLLCVAIVATTAVFVATQSPSIPKEGVGESKLVEADEGKAAAAQEGTAGSVQSSINMGSKLPDQAANVDKAKDNSPSAKTDKDDKKQTPPVQSPKGNTPEQTKPAPAKTTPAKTTTASAGTTNIKLTYPVFGQITLPFAMKELIYSKTLDERRAHSGIDIGAERGTVVKASADGVVKEIKSDPRLGYTVIIDHSNGIKTVYANLASDDVVTPNQIVKKGDIIGSVGNTAFFEAAEENHLHFEVLKNNESVDPTAYLPKN